MRRLNAAVPGAVAAAAVGVLLSACGAHRPVEVVEGDADPALFSTVAMGDALAASQLKSGFYQVEQNTWRWTAGRFEVVLQAPRSAARAGANLVFRFAIPESILTRVGPMTLSATVNGTPLAPARYEKAGEYTYTREVAASLLLSGLAQVQFRADPFLPAGQADTRELALVAVSAGLEAK